MITATQNSSLPALKILRQEAEKAMTAGPWSVMDKKPSPPSGDKHDYLSLGTYWWPDPAKPDGLPYIRRDGERNPEILTCDVHPLEQMTTTVNTLAAAFSSIGDEKYAERAAKLLRTWFLDKSTRMNPHLEYGQAIRGICDGRCIGIIDTAKMRGIPEASDLLTGSRAWGKNDANALRQWFHQYLDWLINSKHGQSEAHEQNNHGTWYDVQVVIFALFTGQKDIAARILQAVPEKRMAVQIESDGSQPKELARTLSFNYSVFNLTGLMTLAQAGEKLGIDLWHTESANGRGIRKALDWYLPYTDGSRSWSFKQIQPVKYERLVLPLRLGALRYGDSRYETALQHLHCRQKKENDNANPVSVNTVTSAPDSRR